MTDKDGQANNTTSQMKNLDDLISAYNKKDTSQAPEKITKVKMPEVNREALIENGLIIDPELIREAAGNDAIIPIQPVKRTGPAKTVLKTSSGEKINTRQITNQPQPAEDELTDMVMSDQTISDDRTAKTKQEINRIMRKAYQKYGKRNYDRLDPINYTDEKIAYDKAKRLRKRINMVLIAVIIVILIGSIGGVITWYSLSSSKYEHNICSEQDVADAIKYYRDNDLQGVSAYVSSNLQSGYSSDAKCLYISMIEYNLMGSKAGYKYSLDSFNDSPDKKKVMSLIKQYNGPIIEQLGNIADK